MVFALVVRWGRTSCLGHRGAQGTGGELHEFLLCLSGLGCQAGIVGGGVERPVATHGMGRRTRRGRMLLLGVIGVMAGMRAAWMVTVRG